MFEKIKKDEIKKSYKNNNTGVSISPVPQDVEIEIPEHFTLGKPDQYWEYRSAENNLLFIVCRFTNEDGKKRDSPPYL